MLVNKHAPIRSLDEWMNLIIECRQSGLNDAAWCREKGISVSSFYNAATRLRKINIEYIDKTQDKSMREVYGLDPKEAE